MSRRDTLLLLDDMFQSAQKIKRYTKDLDGSAPYNSDNLLQELLNNLHCPYLCFARVD